MTSVREARRDAKEYARAEMFYGEGAGIRRRLIAATVEGKASRDPAYGKAFKQALEKQDMAVAAAKARKERERIDRTRAVSRNTKAILTGNHNGANTAVLVIGVAAYYMHQTGLDKKAWAKGKEIHAKLKHKWEHRNDDKPDAPVYDISSAPR